MPKAGIHPTYYPKAQVTCSCGASYEMGSTKESLKLDICRTCHPFYTGNQKLIDTAGRVDRFKAKMAAAKPSKKSQVKSEKAEVTESQPKADDSSSSTESEALQIGDPELNEVEETKESE